MIWTNSIVKISRYIAKSLLSSLLAHYRKSQGSQRWNLRRQLSAFRLSLLVVWTRICWQVSYHSPLPPLPTFDGCTLVWRPVFVWGFADFLLRCVVILASYAPYSWAWNISCYRLCNRYRPWTVVWAERTDRVDASRRIVICQSYEEGKNKVHSQQITVSMHKQYNIHSLSLYATFFREGCDSQSQFVRIFPP